VTPYTSHELDAASHPYALPKETGRTVVSIDVNQTGLGNASCGPPPLEKYRMPSDGTYQFRITMRPCVIREGDFSALRQSPYAPVNRRFEAP